MDVPFHSSGAISRSHYALVRKVETSSTVQMADQHIFLEIKSLQDKLAYPNISTDKRKEHLLVLLYCATSVTPGYLEKDTFEFALLHAINLIETGKKIEYKRIGYLFCAELLPTDHELRLMLVNTIRKDLESEEVPRICLALDNLITSPSEVVIPAVQIHLHELLSHDKASVRRRALLAFRALSKYDPGLIDRVGPNVVKMLKDLDDSVVRASLALLRDCSFPDEKIRTKGKNKANEILATESRVIDMSNVGLVIETLNTIRSLGILESTIPILFEILGTHSERKTKNPLTKALLLDIFRTMSQLDAGDFAAREDVIGISAVRTIKHLFSSASMNDIYLFLSCLECVHVINWAGTTSSRPSALQADEFERIMQMLNISDQTIRKKIMRLIKSVDPSLLDVHMSLVSESLLNNPQDTNTITVLLDLILIRYDEDGSKYAAKVLELISAVEKPDKKPRVSKQIIETVLDDLRGSLKDAVVASAVGRFVQVVIKNDESLGATAIVIATALITEYFHTLSVAPSPLLSGLASRLRDCASIVQEPCILAMMRISSQCDDIPSDVHDVINNISKTGSQVVQNRCAQFIEYSVKKEELVQIIEQAASPSLPDFLLSLVRHRTPRSNKPSQSHQRMNNQNLRYAAYASPQIGPRLMGRPSTRHMSLSSSSIRTHPGSPAISAGELALTSGLEDLNLGVDHGPVVPADDADDLSLIDLQVGSADFARGS